MENAYILFWIIEQRKREQVGTNLYRWSKKNILYICSFGSIKEWTKSDVFWVKEVVLKKYTKCSSYLIIWFCQRWNKIRCFLWPKGCYARFQSGQNEKLSYRWGEIEQKRTLSSVLYERILIILNFAKTTEQFVLRFSVQRRFLIIWNIIEK